MFSRQAGEIEQSAYVAKVGTLVNTNHHLLNALGVGHGELTKIWEISRSAAMPSKLTGAGGGMFGWAKCLSCVVSQVVPMIRSILMHVGGCAFTLCPFGASEEMIDDVRKQLR